MSVPSNVPVFRKLRTSIVPNAPDWVADMFSNLNLFSEQVSGVFAQGSNLALIQGMTNEQTFTTPSTYATGGFTPLQFAYTERGRPTCFLIGNIIRTDGTPILNNRSLNAYFVPGSPGQVYVTYVTGLLPLVTYTLTTLVL